MSMLLRELNPYDFMYYRNRCLAKRPASSVLKGKLLLSIFYFNMEVWRLPSNFDIAKDAVPNNVHQHATTNRGRQLPCAKLSDCGVSCRADGLASRC